MLSFELNDRRHRGNRIFVDDTGKIWYGKSEDGLVDPHGLDVTGRLAPFDAVDIQAAVNTGMVVTLQAAKTLFARELLAKGDSPATVAEKTNMPLPEVLKIARQ